MNFPTHNRNAAPAPARDPNLPTIRVRISKHNYERSAAIELRFDYHADFKDHIKAQISVSKLETGALGGWNPSRKCWVIDEIGWTNTLIRGIKSYRFANVILVKENS